MRSYHQFFVRFLLACVLFAAAIGATASDLPLSTRQMSMGFVASSGQAEALGIFANPATLCQTRRWNWSSFYSRPYGLKEIDLAAVAFALRIDDWTIALAGSFYGFDLYNEQLFSLGVGYPLISSLRLGVAFRYQQVTIKKYGQDGTLAMDVGWQYDVSPHAKILGACQNINRATIGTEQQALPQTLRMALQLDPLANMAVVGEIYKDLLFPPEARFGLELQVIKAMQLRCGFTRNPSRFTGGLAIHVDGLSLNYAFSYHNVLGYTHATGITFSK